MSLTPKEIKYIFDPQESIKNQSWHVKKVSFSEPLYAVKINVTNV